MRLIILLHTNSNELSWHYQSKLISFLHLGKYSAELRWLLLNWPRIRNDIVLSPHISCVSQFISRFNQP